MALGEVPGPQCTRTPTAHVTKTQERRTPRVCPIIFCKGFRTPNLLSKHKVTPPSRTKHPRAENVAWPLSSCSGEKDTDKRTLEQTVSTVIRVEGPSACWGPCYAISRSILGREKIPLWERAILPIVKAERETRARTKTPSQRINLLRLSGPHLVRSPGAQTSALGQLRPCSVLLIQFPCSNVPPLAVTILRN